MKKFTRIVALSLVLAMILGTNVFADDTSLDISSELATDGEDVTDEITDELEDVVDEAEETTDSNEAAIAVAAADVLSGETKTYTSSDQVSCLVQLGYSYRGNDGPISITKGTLTYKNWWWTETKTVYLVCMSGTDTDAENQTTDWWTDLLSGFQFDNQYVRNIKKVIQENVPAGSNIILAGHSLGGMVAQQVASDSDIKKGYNVMNTVTFGSPLINGLKREGTVKRLGDTSDVVPYLSINTVLNLVWQVAGLNREDGGYTVWDLSFKAHCQSYNRNDVWGAYDPCGEKNGSRKLTLDFSTTHFYASPVVVTE